MPLKDGRYKGAHRATRRSLIEMLKVRGELSTLQMADRLGVSAMAVRQHLLELESEGDVSSASRPTGKGRPTRFWKLTTHAERYFSDRHRDLLLDLLRNVDSACGEGAMERLLDERCEQQAAAYGEKLRDCASVGERVQALAELRSEEGYMAEVVKEEEGTLMLVENHCPICSAASSCAGLCASELRVFSRVLGPGCSVERVEHMLEGSRRCAYRVRLC